MKHEEDYLKEVCAKFFAEEKAAEVKPYGTGHINDSYAASYNREPGIERHLLQRVNHLVFTDVPALMDNVVRVTGHIRNKLERQNEKDIDRKVLTVIPTADGNSYYEDAKGNFWRMYIFIEKAGTYDVPESLKQIYQAARAFGNFQQMLSDMPSPRLADTIPDFHNAAKRLDVYKKVLKADVCNRAKSVKREIEFLQKNEQIFYSLAKLAETGEIPIRVTHNDTKINNVLIDDATAEGICVIDIDTVMPGVSLYDFGDIVRTCASSAAEDEPDFSKAQLEMPRFEAILEGFLSTAGKFLTKAEKENLILGGKYITLMIGMRFLTDYLNGDKYFKIHRPEHNLDRCRTQFELVGSINRQEEEMTRLVRRISSL